MNYQDSQLGESALHRAAANNQTDLAIYLLHKGARKDLKDNIGRTPLDLASVYPDLYAMLASNIVPPISAEAIEIENALQKWKHKIP